jgi:hypothetical protein
MHGCGGLPDVAWAAVVVDGTAAMIFAASMLVIAYSGIPLVKTIPIWLVAAVGFGVVANHVGNYVILRSGHDRFVGHLSIPVAYRIVSIAGQLLRFFVRLAAKGKGPFSRDPRGGEFGP